MKKLLVSIFMLGGAVQAHSISLEDVAVKAKKKIAKHNEEHLDGAIQCDVQGKNFFGQKRTEWNKECPKGNYKDGCSGCSFVPATEKSPGVLRCHTCKKSYLVNQYGDISNSILGIMNKEAKNKYLYSVHIDVKDADSNVDFLKMQTIKDRFGLECTNCDS